MIIKVAGLVSLLILAPVLYGCGPTVDLDAEYAELMRIHALNREAHLGKDASRIAALISDDFLNVARGEISHWSRDDMVERLQPYLDRSTFLEWDDIEEPVVRISDDGTMAFVVILKSVRLTQQENGETVEGHTIFAWTETYEKRGGEWRLTTITSTDKPGDA